jgi:hypothetical protein
MEFIGAFYVMLAAAAVGAVFSRSRGRDPILGATLGFLIGPIGWLIELLAADPRPICTECGGRTVLNARRCWNCGAEIMRPAPPPVTPRHKPMPPTVPVSQRPAEADYAERY